ncbi:MAG: putative O-linked N-acetylglucosamine transferase (SPINDLY family), partial [Myxococcota bacterium]
AAAFYERLGWTVPVAKDAADYARLAVWFATDPAARAASNAALRVGSGRLFNNTDGVRQFEDLLTESLALKVAFRERGTGAA